MHLSIEVPEEKAKQSFLLTRSSLDLLEKYRDYKSKAIKLDLTSDTIIESLIKKLKSEKEFKILIKSQKGVSQ